MATNPPRYYSFRTDMHDGEGPRSCSVLGHSIRDAVETLRGMLYDGETIIGWR